PGIALPGAASAVTDPARRAGPPAGRAIVVRVVAVVARDPAASAVLDRQRGRGGAESSAESSDKRAPGHWAPRAGPPRHHLHSGASKPCTICSRVRFLLHGSSVTSAVERIEAPVTSPRSSVIDLGTARTSASLILGPLLAASAAASISWFLN